VLASVNKLFAASLTILNTIRKCTTNRVGTDEFPGYEDQDATASPCGVMTRTQDVAW